MKKYIISVDGPMASGKGTVSRLLAQYLKFGYLDTGLLFRQVAWGALQAGINLQDSKAVGNFAKVLDIKGNFDEKSLRTEEVSQAASIVAQHESVREALLALERKAPENLSPEQAGIVVDGRDIGSVVFPDANFKFYITATPQERAKRRFKELQMRGESCKLPDVLQEMMIRDDRDAKRGVSPLKIPKGAFIIDTTGIDPEETVRKMLEVVKEASSK